MGEHPLTAVGELLEAARGELPLTEVCDRARVSHSTWRRIVRGSEHIGAGIVLPANPRPETLIRMAVAVGVDPAHALAVADVAQDAPPISLSHFSTDQLLAELRRRATG